MYPQLRIIFGRIGVLSVVIASFVLSLAIMFFYPWQTSTEWKLPNHAITALLLSPCWVLGCMLAEVQVGRASKSKGVISNASRLWALRSLVLITSVAAQVMHFKTSICYRYTLPIFSLFVFVWLILEFQNTRIPALFVNAGKACYSIYLTHWLAESSAVSLLPHAGRLLLWTVQLASAVAIATLFYWLIERPSHQLARRLRHL